MVRSCSVTGAWCSASSSRRLLTPWSCSTSFKIASKDTGVPLFRGAKIEPASQNGTADDLLSQGPKRGNAETATSRVYRTSPSGMSEMRQIGCFKIATKSLSPERELSAMFHPLDIFKTDPDGGGEIRSSEVHCYPRRIACLRSKVK